MNKWTHTLSHIQVARLAAALCASASTLQARASSIPSLSGQQGIVNAEVVAALVPERRRKLDAQKASMHAALARCFALQCAVQS